MTTILLILVKVSIATLIAAVGMGASIADVSYLWRRPALLARSLLAMYVLVPLAAFGMTVVLPLAPSVKAALLVLAVSAGAPLLPRKLQQFGDKAYGFSLVVTSSLLAIVVTPAWVAFLAGLFGVSADLSWWDVAFAIGAASLVPLLLGMMVGHLVPSVRERWAGRLAAFAAAAMTASSLLLLAAHWAHLVELRAARQGDQLHSAIADRRQGRLRRDAGRER